MLVTLTDAIYMMTLEIKKFSFIHSEERFEMGLVNILTKETSCTSLLKKQCCSS